MNFSNNITKKVDFDINAHTSLDYIVQTVNVVNILFSLWIFFALLNFARYQKKKIKRSKQKLFLVNYSLCLTIFAVISFVSTQSILFVEWFSYRKNDETCQRITDFAAVFFLITLLLIYLFPWLRQRYLYQQAPLSHLNTTFVKVMCAVSLLILVLSVTTNGFFVIWPQKFKMMKSCHNTVQCMKLKTMAEDRFEIKFIYYCSAAIVVAIQIFYLALLIRPLLKHRKNKNIQNSLTNKKVVSTLQQLTASALICSFATVAMGVLGEYLDLVLEVRVVLRNSVFDIALNVLLFSVVISYEKWKKILTFSLSRK